eukprot:10323809-Lingulodinium_polyedra.AAC.1
MQSASLRFASRRGGGRSIRSHRCTTFVKRCATLRSSRRFAGTTAHKPHARVLHTNASVLARTRRERA